MEGCAFDAWMEVTQDGEIVFKVPQMAISDV